MSHTVPEQFTPHKIALRPIQFTLYISSLWANTGNGYRPIM